MHLFSHSVPGARHRDGVARVAPGAPGGGAVSVGHATLPWPAAAAATGGAAHHPAHRRLPGAGTAGQDGQPTEKPADLVSGC